MLKGYCRLYQGVMKAAMYLLPWRTPQVIAGAGSVGELPALIKEKGFQKILIVTGKNLRRKGVLEPLLAAMEQQGLDYVLYDGTQPDPTEINVENGVTVYREHHCDAMIAFGGGSPIDCAKAIGARIAQPRKNIAQLQGVFRVHRRIPEIFTVPTTAGAGSETTIAAVITDSKTHRKASINDLVLMPHNVVLDPELTVGLPAQATAACGMDALCHAVESYTNHTYNSKLENELARKAVKLIYDNLYAVYLDGTNIQGRQALQQAAFYAGRAFTRGSVGYVHAIGHTLGGLYGVPHGLAMGILLPHVMRAYGPAVYKRLAELCELCGIPYREDTQQAKAEAFIGWMEGMKEKMGIPRYPDCIQEKDIEQMARWAHKEGNPLYPTPVTWDKKDFAEFLRCLLTQTI